MLKYNISQPLRVAFDECDAGNGADVGPGIHDQRSGTRFSHQGDLACPQLVLFGLFLDPSVCVVHIAVVNKDI